MAKLLSIGVTVDAFFEFPVTGVKTPAKVMIYSDCVAFELSEGDAVVKLAIPHEEWDFIAGVVTDAMARLKAEAGES